ncbi:SUMF1/EgtB/PvdO family nonheme iron enzyme [Teredinibacter turnerae]|uniref:SUMF1/EgtB/PvdO family nonheme iron enzyme n=1 Tax=Teredinibacter turnerae TaxID=2426 RepID=UPI0012BB80F6|nr:SUMF1/EgtB/PvdO family nonheme iron enzyme [Teredinibacter turnerae]
MKASCAKVMGVKKGEENKGRQLLGSAFFIDKHRLITCRHVTEALADRETLYLSLIIGHDALSIEFPNTTDVRHDFALLTLEHTPDFDITPLALAEQTRTTVATSGSATAWGFTFGSEDCVPRQCALIPYQELYEKIAFQHGIPHGYSGGPLVNKQGQCIGVVRAKSDITDCTYAEPVYRLKDWLQREGVCLNQPLLQDWQRKYLQDLVQEMKQLRTDSFLQSFRQQYPTVHTGGSVNLAAVYAPLCVNSVGNTNSETARRNRATASGPAEELQSLTALDALVLHRRCVFRGDPGCGKTTFTRYWVLRLALHLLEQHNPCEEEETLPAEWQQCFPLHIELQQLYRKLPQQKIEKDDLSLGDIDTALETYIADEHRGLQTLEQIDSLTRQGFTLLWFLDGLDEIQTEAEKRSRFLKVLDRWASRLGDLHYVCLTTRPYAYQRGQMQGFEERTIQLLTEEHCFAFIRRLFSELQRRNHNPVNSSHGLVSLLLTPERKHLLKLCLNPMLLTLTSALYFNEGERALPNDRAGLYELCVNKVLERYETKHNRCDGSTYILVSDKTVARETVHKALDELAYYAHFSLSEKGELDRENGNITPLLLGKHFFPYFQEHFNQKEVEDYLYNKTGILLNRDSEGYTFLHRTLREFLAARYLERNNNLDLLHDWIQAFEADPGWWREMLALVVKLYDRNGRSARSTSVLSQLLPFAQTEMGLQEQASQAEADTFAQAVLACAFAESERVFSETSDSSNETKETPQSFATHVWTRPWRIRLQQWLLGIMAQQNYAIEFRAEAGRHLGAIGDPRPGTGIITLPTGAKLPDIQWADIPAGEIKLKDIEDKVFDIPQPFKLAIYPVTHLQFQTFIDDDKGYYNRKWWQGFEPELTEAKQATWQEPNHPRVDISWYEATAFCRWLTDHYSLAGLLPVEGGNIRLPYEWEWQQAACSGDTSRMYPWQGVETSGHCNVGGVLHRTSAVGLFALGRSDQSVCDMAGNVWEWSANNYENPMQSNTLGIDTAKTVRGGAWGYSASNARVSYRGGDLPGGRGSNLGFRVLCCSPCLDTNR